MIEKHITPPAWGDHLIKWVCPEKLQEELQGDLSENFEDHVRQYGESKARRMYVFEVLKFVRPYFLKRKLKNLTKRSEFPSPPFFSIAMIQNYFKIAWRNLVKNKAFSFINIVGLSIGMAVAMLIGLIYDEVSFNRHFENYNRIAKVMQRGTHEGETFHG